MNKPAKVNTSCLNLPRMTRSHARMSPLSTLLLCILAAFACGCKKDAVRSDEGVVVKPDRLSSEDIVIDLSPSDPRAVQPQKTPLQQTATQGTTSSPLNTARQTATQATAAATAVDQARQAATAASHAANQAQSRAASSEKAASASTRAAQQATNAAKAGDSNAAATHATQATQQAAQARANATEARSLASQAQGHADAASKAAHSLPDSAGPSARRAAGDAAARAAKASERAAGAARQAAAHADVAQAQSTKANGAALASKSLDQVRVATTATAQALEATRDEGQASQAAALKTAQAAQRSEAALKAGDMGTAQASANAAAMSAQQAGRAADKAEQMAKIAGNQAEVAARGAETLSQERSNISFVRLARAEVAKAVEDADQAAAIAREARQKAIDARKQAQRAIAALGKSGIPPTALAIDGAVQQDTITKPTAATSRRQPVIDVAQIPSLPEPPPPTQSKPTGVIEARQNKEPPPETLGRWQQVGGDASADFLPGSYTSSVLILRADDVLEVRRTFGKKEEVSMVWEIGFEWNADRTQIILGRDQARRPVPELLKGFTLDDGFVVQGAKLAFPTSLRCTRLESGNVRLGEKSYRQIKNYWESFEVTPKP